MTGHATIVQVIASALVLTFGLSACVQAEKEDCVPREINLDSNGPGFEIVDLLGREVWGTRDLTPQAFEALDMPASWSFWLKNDPRVLVAERGRLFKSPGCKAVGHYTTMQAFGREFLQVVRLISFDNITDSEGQLRRVELEKYHTLLYLDGSRVSILHSPTGERFIRVSTTYGGPLNDPELPAGWTLFDHHLERDLEISLVGEVSVLRTSNEDSYQGPLSSELRF